MTMTYDDDDDDIRSTRHNDDADVMMSSHHPVVAVVVVVIVVVVVVVVVAVYCDCQLFCFLFVGVWGGRRRVLVTLFPILCTEDLLRIRV